MSGKGDRPRPYSIPLKTFDSNWDAIFGKKEVQSSEVDDKITRYNNETQEVKRSCSSVGRAPD